MLEYIRRNRRLGTVVLMACIVLWLVALLAGVPVRALPVAAQEALDPVVCSVLPEGKDGATGALSPPMASAHGVHDVHAAQAADGAASGAEDAEHEGHAGHHGPDCVLCIALSPPAPVAVVVYRPPVPRQGLDWRAPAEQPPSLLAAAPLPARGPPAPLHA